METIYAIAGFLVVTVVLSYFSMKKQKSSWTGVLIDKVMLEDEETSTSYKLVFKTDEGKKVKWDVFKNDFDAAKIGERYKKEKNALFPQKIN